MDWHAHFDTSRSFRPACRNPVTVMLVIVDIFQRRITQLAAFTAYGGQQQNRTAGQSSQTEFILQDGDFENPFEDRSRTVLQDQFIEDESFDPVIDSFPHV
jgi:hypothetical protein